VLGSDCHLTHRRVVSLHACRSCIWRRSLARPVTVPPAAYVRAEMGCSCGPDTTSASPLLPRHPHHRPCTPQEPLRRARALKQEQARCVELHGRLMTQAEVAEFEVRGFVGGGRGVAHDSRGQHRF
jgi:hypothetical protein